jgi:hypothetical protein
MFEHVKAHAVTIGLLLTSIGSFGGSVKTWDEVFQPGFVFGTLAAAGAVLKAAYGPTPGETK